MAQSENRILKLTLRDLFWLVLVVGLALVWLLDRSRLTTRAQNGVIWKTRCEYLVSYFESQGWKVQFHDAVWQGAIVDAITSIEPPTETEAAQARPDRD